MADGRNEQPLEAAPDGRIRRFAEKPLGGEGRINGGFFVLESRVLDRISDDSTIFAAEPLEGLARRRVARLCASRLLASDGYAA